MLQLIFSALNGWHSGKEMKYFANNDFHRALHHCNLALKYARKINNVGTLAMDLESLAKVYRALGENELSSQAAQESLELFRENSSLGPAFKSGVNRLEIFLKK